MMNKSVVLGMVLGVVVEEGDAVVVVKDAVVGGKDVETPKATLTPPATAMLSSSSYLQKPVRRPGH